MKKLLLLSFAVGAAAYSQASFAYRYNFTFSDPNASYVVRDLYLAEAAPGGVINGGYNLGLRYPGPQITAPTGGFIDTYYNTDSVATEALIAGVTQDLPGDAPGQKHVVLAVSNDVVPLASGIAWGTLFRNFTEEQIIFALEHQVDPDEATRNAALQTLGDFYYTDAKYGILDGLAQPHSAWFTPGGSFTVMTWSSGQVIGGGTSTITSVPEPTSMLAIGLGLAAVARRRKRN